MGKKIGKPSRKTGKPEALPEVTLPENRGARSRKPSRKTGKPEALPEVTLPENRGARSRKPSRKTGKPEALPEVTLPENRGARGPYHRSFLYYFYYRIIGMYWVFVFPNLIGKKNFPNPKNFFLLIIELRNQK
jgi:hypothetical protein